MATATAARRQYAFVQRALLALLALLAAMALVVIIGLVSLSSSTDEKAPTDAAYAPSKTAIADIPNGLLPLYLKAGQDYGVDWAILAAIGKIETDHCRSTAPGVKSGGNSKGAMGCMQFLAGTWASYGVDGNKDGARNVYDPQDAIPAAANYLKASGAPRDYHAAIFAYNHAGWYVNEVLAQAGKYRGALAAGPAVRPLSGPSTVNAQAARVLLALTRAQHPLVTIYPDGINDLQTGQIDPRVSSLLVAIVCGSAGAGGCNPTGHTIRVTSLKSGHSINVAGTNRPSNHSFGRAADIAVVDGEVANSDAHGTSGKVWGLCQQLAKMRGPLHPDELIYGIDCDGGGPAFAMSNHKDHIHAGFGG